MLAGTSSEQLEDFVEATPYIDTYNYLQCKQ